MNKVKNIYVIFKIDSEEHIYSVQIRTTASDVKDRHTKQRQIFWTSWQKEEFAIIIVKSPK